VFFFTGASIEKEFKENYGISESDIADFGRSVTCGADSSVHKTPAKGGWSVRVFHILASTFLPLTILGMLVPLPSIACF